MVKIDFVFLMSAVDYVIFFCPILFQSKRKVIMVWEQVTDDQGQLYYYNRETEETQWEVPEGFGEMDRLLKKYGWEKFTTDEGEIYYHNRKTDESVWELPSEVKIGLEETKLSSETITEDQPEKTREQLVETDGEFAERLEDVNNVQSEEKKIGNSIVNELINLDELIKNDLNEKQNDVDKENNDIEASKEAFTKMLEESNVDSKWSFTKVMKVFVKDDRYWNIIDPLMKKQLFEIYLIRKTDKEFQEVENSKEKYKNDYFQILVKYNLNYYTKWKTCSKLIIDEPIYSLIPNKLKREFFEEYVSNLRLKHEEEKREAKHKELDELGKYLRENIDISTEFEMQLGKLVEKFKSLNKLDILTIFESVMIEKEKIFSENFKQDQKLNFRADRKARDNFKKILNEIKQSGKLVISSKLKWFELLPFLKDRQEFIELCGHKGSSGIDFYWDILDLENQKLRAKKDLIKQELINLKKTVKEFENDELQFIEILQNCGNQEINQFSKLDFKYIMESLVEETNQSLKRPIDAMEGNNKRKKLMTLGYGSIR